MTTVDNLLLKITSYTSPAIEEYLPTRDSKVLRSLASAVSSPVFITENQSRLLLKLLEQYRNHFLIIDKTLEDLLVTPTWSKRFRAVDNTKKVYIKTLKDKEPAIFIEYSPNSAIRKTLQGIGKLVENSITVHSTKLISVELTEKNIVAIVELLKPQKFEFDQKITDFYEIIKKWKFADECKKFFVGENLYEPIKSSLEKDIGIESVTDLSIIADRKTRYHFLTKKVEKNEENLQNLIVHRTQQKVWIDSNVYALTDVIKKIKDLKRLPLLVIFDSHSADACTKTLRNLQESLENNEICDHIGIYFRLQNDTTGKVFNSVIQETHYNAPLDNKTNVAGIQTGKLPKFFLKDCNWAPKSVIVFGNNLRHGKTAIYSNRCDLIISYSDKPSIFDNNTGWATSTWAL
jgi:hypothetical protein